jgi:hypothetical protein
VVPEGSQFGVSVEDLRWVILRRVNINFIVAIENSSGMFLVGPRCLLSVSQSLIFCLPLACDEGTNNRKPLYRWANGFREVRQVQNCHKAA